jgi:hypothetical protein
MTEKWQCRVWEGRLLADPEVRKFLQEEGVELTGWREMMRRFEGVAEPRVTVKK